MSIKKYAFSLLIAFLFFSCNSAHKEKNSTIEQETKNIIALLIEKLPPGPPPPPPPVGSYKKDTIRFNKYRDSIFSLDIKIGVYNETANFSPTKRKFKELDSQYVALLTTYKNQVRDRKEKIEIKKLPVKQNRHLIEINKNDNTRELLLQNKLDFIIRFSPIIFNDQLTKAIVYSSAYSHPLNGEKGLFFLEKRANVWYIFKKESLSIS